MMLELALTVDRTDRVKARELFVVTEGNLEKTLAVLSDGICYVKKVKKKLSGSTELFISNGHENGKLLFYLKGFLFFQKTKNGQTQMSFVRW